MTKYLLIAFLAFGCSSADDVSAPTTAPAPTPEGYRLHSMAETANQVLKRLIREHETGGRFYR